MKTRGFTLIELLAVIVILAIIALIAVPIVLNIINNARESAKERSRDLYAKAVQNAVLKEQLNGDTIKDGHYEKVSDTSICRFENYEPTNDCITVEVEGEKPVEYTMEILDGKITSQTIKLKTNDPTYTKEGNGKWIKDGETNTNEGTSNTEEPNTPIVSVPDYYYWGSGSINGGLPTTNIDPDVSNITIPDAHGDKEMYLGFDSADGTTIDTVYLCFKQSGGEQYCLIGNNSDPNIYTANQNILREAYADYILDPDSPGCSFAEDYTRCRSINLNSNGTVSIESGIGVCNVGNDSFNCYLD